MIHDMPFTDHGCTGCKLENEVDRLRAEVERLNTEMDSLPRLLKPHERVIDTRRVGSLIDESVSLGTMSGATAELIKKELEIE